MEHVLDRRPKRKLRALSEDLFRFLLLKLFFATLSPFLILMVHVVMYGNSLIYGSVISLLLIQMVDFIDESHGVLLIEPVCKL